MSDAVAEVQAAHPEAAVEVWIPEGLHLVTLPSHTPELQPAERLWLLLHEPIANRTFTDLNALEPVLVERCAYLTTQPAAVKGLTNYHWWPQQ